MPYTDAMPRPEETEEKHLVFLDELRDGATINMASPEAWRSLVEMFDLSPSVARAIHQYWMDSFRERHPKNT